MLRRCVPQIEGTDTAAEGADTHISVLILLLRVRASRENLEVQEVRDPQRPEHGQLEHRGRPHAELVVQVGLPCRAGGPEREQCARVVQPTARWRSGTLGYCGVLWRYSTFSSCLDGSKCEIFETDSISSSFAA